MLTFLINKLKIINYTFSIASLVNLLICLYITNDLNSIKHYEKSIFMYIELFLVFIYLIVIFIYYYYQNKSLSFKKKNKKINIIGGEEELNVYLDYYEEDMEKTEISKNLFSPIHYYFIGEDLSLNFTFKLKWIRYYVKAIEGIIDILNDEKFKLEKLSFENNIDCNETLQDLSSLKNLNHKKYIIELFVEDKFIIIDDKFDINILIEDLENINDISEFVVYSAYSIVNIKLKINLLEFIILTASNYSLGFHKKSKDCILI